MRLALDICRRGVDAGQSPFGACIARGGEILACAHNRVRLDNDATAHAEVLAIREACKRAADVHLPGATLYSTTEPCPMCFAAMHWAGIERVVFGACIADASSFGFNELPISNETMSAHGGDRIEVVAGILAEESIELFRLWSEGGGAPY